MPLGDGSVVRGHAELADYLDDPERGDAKTWLTVMARRIAIDELRRHRPVTVAPEDVEIADPADAQAYWDSLRPAAVQVPQHDSITTPMFDVTRVTLAEVTRIGAKASNLGELLQNQVDCNAVGTMSSPT